VGPCRAPASTCSPVRRWWSRGPALDLGDGVWLAAADRLQRALRSFERVARAVPSGPARDELEAAFGLLSAAVSDGRTACAAAQRAAPSTGLDVPPGQWGVLHHRLTRLGAEIAAAAEGAAMVRAGDLSPVARVSTRATRVRDQAADIRAGASRG